MSGNLFYLSDHAWNLLNQVSVALGIFAFALSAAGVLYGFAKRERFRAWLRANRFDEVGGEVAGDAAWEGIVFTVSRAEIPRWVMERVAPKRIALVATEGSRQAAMELVEAATAKGVEVIGPDFIADPDDPEQARTAAAHLLGEMGRRGEGRIAVDVTGGKVPMSIGAFMAAEEAGADTLYATAQYRDGKPDKKTLRLITLSRPGGRGAGD